MLLAMLMGFEKGAAAAIDDAIKNTRALNREKIELKYLPNSMRRVRSTCANSIQSSANAQQKTMAAMEVLAIRPQLSRMEYAMKNTIPMHLWHGCDSMRAKNDKCIIGRQRLEGATCT